MLTNEEFLNGNGKNPKISTEIVDVEGQEFKKAVRITCPEKTPHIYDAQFEIPLKKNFKPGDMGMLVVSSRKISGGDNDTNVGGVQFVIEQAETPWYKALQQDGVVVQNEWTKSYMPFNVNESLGTNVHMTVRVGHFAQVLEIGGVEIINYKDAITAEQLPSTKTYEGMEEGAQWREEALQRIEKIRKGDFKLVIKDENGNIIPNANIKVNMTEHEFQWGTAVSTPLLAEGQAGEIYRSNLIKYFNSAVLENHMKWHYYEDDPTIPRKLVDTLKDIGIKNIRGHALVWDKSSLSGNGINSSLPDRVLEATAAKDRDKVQGYIKEHMTKIMEEYKDDLVEWDTTNELFRDDTYIRNVFGNDIVVEWFNMANEANVGNQKIYMNEHQMVGTDNYLDKLVPLLEELKAKGAKWDGIGSQAHFAYPCYPPKFYDQLEVLGKYADELKITEYDFSINDENIHASFTRDILITIFSHEKVQGFYCWGFVDGGRPIYMLFDKNWNRKKTADQYEDLVYNKWWTREAGTTNANGEFDVRAFYGDYDITVNVGGVEKTVNVPLRKANKGTVEVVVK
jgi:GH35 family endo-1,4-beta-xylanase